MAENEEQLENQQAQSPLETPPPADYAPTGALATTSDIRKEATVAGQMEGLLSDESPYTTMARTKAAETAATKGLLNTSMAVQAGEAAAIESVLPIAQQDAETYAQAGETAREYTYKGALSGQESEQRIAEDVSKGEITKELTAQEYDLKTDLMEREYAQKSTLSSQEHLQDMDKLVYEWGQKSGLSTQEAGQDIDFLIKEMQLREGMTELEAALELQRMQEEYTYEEMAAAAQDLRDQAMARLNSELAITQDTIRAEWDMLISDMKNQNDFDIATLNDLGQTTRHQMEIATETYLTEIGIESDELRMTMDLLGSAGNQLQAAITEASTSDLDGPGKEQALNNANLTYMSTSQAVAQLAGLNITWDEEGFATIEDTGGGGDTGTGGGDTDTTGGGTGGSDGSTVAYGDTIGAYTTSAEGSNGVVYQVQQGTSNLYATGGGTLDQPWAWTDQNVEGNFSEDYYLQNKADQLNSKDSSAEEAAWGISPPYTAAKVAQIFDMAGITAKEHYDRYARSEGVKGWSTSV